MSEGYLLWRDFDWDEFIRSESAKCPSDADRHELKEAVRVVREFLRVFSKSKISRDDVRKIGRIEKTTRVQTLSHSLAILAQLANVSDKKKRELDHKLMFAVTAISHAATYCREGKFTKILPVLTRFAKELGE